MGPNHDDVINVMDSALKLVGRCIEAPSLENLFIKSDSVQPVASLSICL
jgi:hypothetical protein